MRVIGGKYEIVRPLGEGGMGAVYEARHSGTGRRVAVKEIISEALHKSPGVVERFQREARATGAIESQHIALVLDTGTDETSGNPYLVMQFLQGEDLQQLIARLGPLPEPVALRIGAQACIGLARAHDAGVVHRDIKPANIYLAKRDGGEIVVKLVDFGIARVRAQVSTPQERALTTTGTMIGSPLYMSPEQAQDSKNLDHRTDLWSLGVVLHEALSGKTPHGDAVTVGALIVAICSKPARPITDVAPHVSAGAAAIVKKALEIDPAARYASAEEMLADIKRVLGAGTALDESMLVALPESLRERVEPKDALALAATEASGSIPSASTTAGASTGSPGVPVQPSRSSRFIVGGAIALAVGVGVGVTVWQLTRTQSQPAHVETATTTSARPEPTPTVSAVTATTSVPLQVVPPNADVEVDEQKATVTNGVVMLTGERGSTHKVVVSRGSSRTTATVVISTAGPVPGKVELSQVAAPPPTRTPTKPVETAPGINRNFEGK